MEVPIGVIGIIIGLMIGWKWLTESWAEARGRKVEEQRDAQGNPDHDWYFLQR